jgi:SAM-dependent methyltransferase
MIQISREISPKDAMFEAMHRNLDGYLEVGRQALDLLKRYCDAPNRVLDFACGHGRVLRHIVSEWPDAEVWASDLDPEAVEFCERAFGARGVVSDVDPENVTLPRFDLIWVGSLFTHLEPVAWRGFLRLLAESLDGVLALSLEGPFIADRIRNGEEMGVLDRADGLLRDFDTTGFGFREYPRGRRKGYGVALVSPDRIENELETVGLRLIAHEPQGWIGRQDVAVAVPRSN